MQAEILWEKLRPQIIHEAKKMLKFSNTFELNDFINESFIAIDEAVRKYNEFNTGMKQETYCIWYIRKYFYNMATQNGEVIYEVYFNNRFQFYLTNHEYRRLKRQLEAKGFTVVPRRISYNESKLFNNKTLKKKNGNG